MTVSQDNWLSQRAAACPDRLAVRSHEGDLTYAELFDEAHRTAGALAAAGASPGACVALDLPPGREFACAFHASMCLGAVALPIGRRLLPAEREAMLTRHKPAVIVTSPDLLPAPAHDAWSPQRLDLDAVLCRLETSGTTGAPQRVDLTYGNYLTSAVGSAFNLGIDPTDRWLCCLPLNHVGGLSILVRSLIYGTAAIVHDGFDSDRVGESLARDDVTIVSLVATQLARLLDAGIDLSGPRALVLGGGPVPVDLIARAQSEGARVVQTYGMTEACSQVTTLAPAEALANPGSVGRAALGVELRVVSEELWVRGPMVAPGHGDAQGWLHTGDRGRVGADGFVYVDGRLDDVIVTGGENVMPQDVEEALVLHQDVEEAAVIGRLDPEWQEAVTAVVVLRDGAAEDADALREHCAALLAGYKVPKRIEFAVDLPKTPSGKVRRRALREAAG